MTDGRWLLNCSVTMASGETRDLPATEAFSDLLETGPRCRKVNGMSGMKGVISQMRRWAVGILAE